MSFAHMSGLDLVRLFLLLHDLFLQLHKPVTSEDMESKSNLGATVTD